MRQCPECGSSLVIALHDPWEHPELFRCMMCNAAFGTTAFGQGPRHPGLPGASDLPATQVKIRIVADEGLLDPLGWARDGAQRLEWSGEPVAAAGVGTIMERQDGRTEITFLLLIRGPADAVEASERAHRRVAQVLGGDTWVLDIQTAAAVPLYADLGGLGRRTPPQGGALRHLKTRP